MRPGRAYTLVVQRDGALDSRTIRVPVWALRTGIGVATGLLVLVAVGLASYAPIVRSAARVPTLEREIARLSTQNAKIVELGAAVDSLERRYAQVRKMIGADIIPDPVGRYAALPVAPAIRVLPESLAPRYELGPKRPTHWPLDESGFLTRGQVGANAKDEAHPGIDIAVPVGSMVRAAGGGTVAESGQDPEYGWFVLLDHADGYQSMYGHLSRRLVSQGDTVQAGQVIGLTGNSGRSSAPHLHFEIRRQGSTLDPLTMVKEGRP
ncbi:MAG TPA: M23 family metallopeptidase [Gemmatimonadales bacterium]|nr:M23 family metallopeptidase [Gemmatimonadales bacterium]